jgi:hypothetical protein
MTPEPSLVTELRSYDPRLRIRWARHSERFFIERKMEHLHPDMAADRITPPADDAPPLRRDLWESWREGYLHILSVDREMAHWRFVEPELARLDSWRQGGFKAINDAADEAAVAWDKAGDKKIEDWAHAASLDAADHAGWFEKRTVSMFERRDEVQYVDSGLGFKVRDRRHHGE